MPSDSEWSFEQPKPRKRLRRQSFDRAQSDSLILKEKAFFDSHHDFEVPSEEIQMKAITKNETEPGPKELELRKKKSIDDSTPVSPLLEQTSPAVASKPLWPGIISNFLRALQLDQTLKVFETEMLVLPNSLYRNADSLLISSLKGDKLLDETPALDSLDDYKIQPGNTHNSNLDQEDADAIEYKDSIQEMGIRVQDFINRRRVKINQSNLKEFIDPVCYGGVGCARASPATIDKAHHKKIQMIHNRHGPLLPTVKGGPNAQAKELSALSKTLGSAVDCQNLSTGPSGATIIERLENAEKHLNLVIDSGHSPLTTVERIRAVELKLIQLERDFPTWAAIHFKSAQ